MRMASPISHADTVEALTRLLGFRIVKDEGLQTDMRKGGFHVVVRSFVQPKRTEIRFHEDRGQGTQRLVLESSARLLRFKAQLQVALDKQERIHRERLETFEKSSESEAVKHLLYCRFYKICPQAREDRYYCVSGVMSDCCDEFQKFRKLEKLEGGKGFHE